MLSIFFLAIIQGITEFLPISSSAHLIIFRDIFLVGKNVIDSNIELSFDIALHFGTLLAIFVSFYKDIRELKNNHKMIRNIAIATIPAAIFGFLFEDIIEIFIRTKYLLIIICLIIVGIILYLIDIKSKINKSLKEVSLKDSLIIGICQIFALIPGFSRSGTTIIGSRLLGINREDSTKFSFLLSIPIISGALFLQLFKTDYNILFQNIDIFMVGILTSFIVGLLCIRLLINYVKTNNFKIFMWYRLLMGILVIIYLIKH